MQGTLDMLILRTIAPAPAHGHTIAHAIEQTSGDVLQVEECDPGSFATVSCASLGFSGDQADCLDDCRADTSSCGPAFTPTSTSTSTATTSPTGR